MAAEDLTPGDEGSGSLSGWEKWFLLDGNRLQVMGVVVIVLFAFLVVVAVSGLAPLDRTQPLYYVFSALISGNLTLVTVVVAINQLLLSREFNTPKQFRSQMEGVIDYRSEIEEITGQVAPVQPSGFLRLLVESTRREAQTLGGLSYDEANEEVHDELDSITSTLTSEIDQVDALIKESETSTFQALSAILTTNYAPQINRLRRTKKRRADELPDDVENSIDELVQRLKDIDIARQYFKTLYLQEELAVLSRLLFYVGLVSLAVVVSGLLLLTASSGAVVPTPYLSLIVAGIITVGLFPITLLFAFILRIATVTQRTAATIPFTTTAMEQ